MIETSDEKEQAAALADVLRLLYKPAVVADVGCNSGLYLEGFRDAGCQVMGFDCDDEALALAAVPVTKIDITSFKPIDFRADMALCLEVLEHIPAEKEDAALLNLCTVSDTIIFSAAVPGQGGDGHINCQPKQHWIDKFEELGFRAAEAEAEYILAQLNGYPGIMGWLRNNLIVFHRQHVPSKFKKRLRLHVVSLPHTQTTKEYLPCAYTQKVVNFCRMMKSLDHEVFLYASEDNDAPCDELITCITKEQQRAQFPKNDWKKDFFAIEWDNKLPYWRTMNDTAIREMEKRLQKKDFICVIGGNCQKPIADAFPAHSTVEFGIGYEGNFSRFRVFESYAWMHYSYGKQGVNDGQYYDAVIPNYFDPADFPFQEERDNYFLFIGRLTKRKGPEVAAEVCRRLGAKLILAGQGCISQKKGEVVGDGVVIQCDVEHVGTVDVKQRGQLMARARGVFVPTAYIGPFEGVHVEAMMCGTPVITTDWGVFSETVLDSGVGYRCRTLSEFMWAAGNVDGLCKQDIRDYAIKRFALDNVRHLYENYFFQVLALWNDGWYETRAYHPGVKRSAFFI